jgi:hypothetical protein
VAWADAQICFGLTDPRAIQDAGKLIFDGTSLPLYGLLFVLLQIQDYALLAGSLALLAALAAVMFVTRRVDWYGTAPANLPEPATYAPPPEPTYGQPDDGNFAGPLP